MNLKIEVLGYTFNLLYLIPIFLIYGLIVTFTCCGCTSLNVPYVEGFQSDMEKKKNMKKEPIVYKKKEDIVVEPIPLASSVKNAAELASYQCDNCHVYSQ